MDGPLEASVTGHLLPSQFRERECPQHGALGGNASRSELHFDLHK